MIDQSIDSLGSRKYISNWNISKRLWTESGQIKAKNLFQNKLKPQDYETTGNLSLDKFGGVHYLRVLRNSWAICKRKAQIRQKMRKKKKKEMYFLEVTKNGTWRVNLCLLCDYCDDFLRRLILCINIFCNLGKDNLEGKKIVFIFLILCNIIY